MIVNDISGRKAKTLVKLAPITYCQYKAMMVTGVRTLLDTFQHNFYTPN